jgi:hypothetical protein
MVWNVGWLERKNYYKGSLSQQLLIWRLEMPWHLGYGIIGDMHSYVLHFINRKIFLPQIYFTIFKCYDSLGVCDCKNIHFLKSITKFSVLVWIFLNNCYYCTTTLCMPKYSIDLLICSYACFGNICFLGAAYCSG